MPRPISADWDSLKALYLKGVTLPDIAKQAGISYSALRARSHRYKWPASAAAGAALLQHSVTLTLQERGGLWGGRMATLLERQLTHLESLEPSQLKLKELELLAHIIETTD